MTRPDPARPTPSQTVGPFYSYALPYQGGPELLPPHTAGTIRLHGTVFDGGGLSVPDALIEIWQTDAAGLVVRQPGGGGPVGALFLHDGEARIFPCRFGAVCARHGLRPRPAQPPLHPCLLLRRVRSQRQGPVYCRARAGAGRNGRRRIGWRGELSVRYPPAGRRRDGVHRIPE